MKPLSGVAMMSLIELNEVKEYFFTHISEPPPVILIAEK
jgi:hypothetical protein